MAKFNERGSDKKRRLDATAIIKRLEQFKRLRSEGDGSRVGYEGWFLFEDLVSVLETSISFSKPLPDSVKRRLISDALFSPAATKTLTKDSVLREINAREAEYIRRAPVKYFLATSISVPANLKIPVIKFVGGTITFSSDLPKKINRQPLESAFKETLHNPHPAGYLVLTVAIQSRSVGEAFEAAMEELDYVRGAWNFASNRGIREVFSNGLRRPINPFCLGQVHTLHDSEGNLTGESYWYNLSFVHHVPILSGSNWRIAKVSLKSIRRLVKTSRYPADLCTAFIKYTRALDGIDYEICFIKLWSLLEFLTNCSDGKYDSLIRRCAFLYTEPAYHQQILEHLRQRRNLFVHAATETDLAKSLVFQLKRYVEDILMFHLQNSRRFYSREDAAAFLDLPYDPDDIKKRLTRLKIGLQFRHAPAKTPRAPKPAA